MSLNDLQHAPRPHKRKRNNQQAATGEEPGEKDAKKERRPKRCSTCGHQKTFAAWKPHHPAGSCKVSSGDKVNVCWYQRRYGRGHRFICPCDACQEEAKISHYEFLDEDRRKLGHLQNDDHNGFETAS